MLHFMGLMAVIMEYFFNENLLLLYGVIKDIKLYFIDF